MSAWSKKIRFNDAFEAALEVLKENSNRFSGRVVLLRNLFGHMSLYLEDKPDAKGLSAHETLAKTLYSRLGPFAAGKKRLHYKEELFDAGSIFLSPDLQPLFPDQNIHFLDRRIVSQEWLRPPIQETTIPRATFFGLKGGVGRSTALTVWAWHLANKGKNVLIFDLDLESPGIGSILLPGKNRPSFGVVDWFVEEAAGQADHDLCLEMVATSPLCNGLDGSIRIVPAFGSKTGPYLPKLARCYLDLPQHQGPPVAMADRLQRMVDQIERMEDADISLLDSRAGLHDFAAIAVTRLNAHAFLFGVGSEQTWQGFELLFSDWQRHPDLERFQNRLQMVVSMLPETDTGRCFERFKYDAYDLFAATLYEESGAEEMERFNFDINDDAAPHHPFRINWNRKFQTFDPIGKPHDFSPSDYEAAFGDFLTRADQWLFNMDEQA